MTSHTESGPYRPPAPRPIGPVRSLLRVIAQGEGDLLSLIPDLAYQAMMLPLGPTRRGILYLNDNNGYTRFEDGSRVDSVANRLVVFDARRRHTGASCTDAPWRLVLNLNWLDPEPAESPPAGG